MVKIDLEAYRVGAGRHFKRPTFTRAYATPHLPVDDDLVLPEPVGEAAFSTFYDDLGHDCLFRPAEECHDSLPARAERLKYYFENDSILFSS